MFVMRSIAIFSITAMVLGAGVVSGQDYPSKPIRINTGAAGSGNDFTSRQIAQGISGPLGQPVIVENRGQAFLVSEFVIKAPHVKSGRLRALAISSTTPSVLTPGLPTVAASGLPGYEAIGMTSSLVAAKTPPAIINRLNQEIVRFLNRPEVKEKFLSIGQELITSSPEEMAATIKSDLAKWGKVIKDAGIKVN